MPRRYSFEGNYRSGLHDLPDAFGTQPMIATRRVATAAGDYWDGVSPYLWDYHWTIVVPAWCPPASTRPRSRRRSESPSRIGGVGYESRAVPEGAVTDFIVTTTAGSTGERRQRTATQCRTSSTRGLVSVALRVSGLPDGGTFTITSTYGERGSRALQRVWSLRPRPRRAQRPLPPARRAPRRRQIPACPKRPARSRSRARSPQSSRAAHRSRRSSRGRLALQSPGSPA